MADKTSSDAVDIQAVVAPQESISCALDSTCFHPCSSEAVCSSSASERLYTPSWCCQNHPVAHVPHRAFASIWNIELRGLPRRAGPSTVSTMLEEVYRSLHLVLH